MLSLAYRIATMNNTTLPRDGYNPTDSDIAELSTYRAKIRNCVKINAQNVADFIAAKGGFANVIDKGSEECRSEINSIPSFAPPFSEFFLEYSTNLCQIGVYVHSLDPSLFVVALSEHHRLAFEKAAWVLLITEFASARGKAAWLMNDTVIAVDKSGRFLSHLARTDRGRFGLNWTSAFVLGMTCSFMHCKNVKQVEAKEDPGERFRKQYKVPKFTYRTLCIDPMKEVLRREGQSETTGLKRALHICRGHFSTYSDEKPLFGKYAGMFWVPDHVRGKKEHGEVVKDYEVKSPAPVAGNGEV